MAQKSRPSFTNADAMTPLHCADIFSYASRFKMPGSPTHCPWNHTGHAQHALYHGPLPQNAHTNFADVTMRAYVPTCMLRACCVHKHAHVWICLDNTCLLMKRGIFPTFQNMAQLGMMSLSFKGHSDACFNNQLISPRLSIHVNIKVKHFKILHSYLLDSVYEFRTLFPKYL